MKCPGCDAENPALASFCFACGERLTSLAQAKSSASGRGADVKLGLLETSPFEGSPLTSGGEKSARTGVDRLHEVSPNALTDTLVDMSPEAVAALMRAASANDTTSADRTTQSGERERAAARRHAERGLIASSGQDSAWGSTRDSGPLRGDSTGPTATPSMVLTRADVPLDVTQDAPAGPASGLVVGVGAPEPAWSDAGAVGDGKTREDDGPREPVSFGDDNARSASVSSDDDDFELRRAKKVTLVHRLLIVFIVACLGAGAYFLISGVRAMRVVETPVKVGLQVDRGSLGDEGARTKHTTRVVPLLMDLSTSRIA